MLTLSRRPNRVGVTPLTSSPEDGKISIPERCFLQLFGISDDGESAETQ
jgi:hypothetical protein